MTGGVPVNGTPPPAPVRLLLRDIVAATLTVDTLVLVMTNASPSAGRTSPTQLSGDAKTLPVPAVPPSHVAGRASAERPRKTPEHADAIAHQKLRPDETLNVFEHLRPALT